MIGARVELGIDETFEKSELLFGETNRSDALLQISVSISSSSHGLRVQKAFDVDSGRVTGVARSAIREAIDGSESTAA
jgi:hypothetical protein